MPSLLPRSQILASTGCLRSGQSLSWSSYQMVLKIDGKDDVVERNTSCCLKRSLWTKLVSLNGNNEVKVVKCTLVEMINNLVK